MSQGCFRFGRPAGSAICSALLIAGLSSAVAADKVVVRFATRPFETAASGFISQQKFYTEYVIPAFEKAHHDIDVQWEPLTGDWVPKLATEIAADSAPDVFEMWGPFDRAWGIQGLVLDLNPYVKRDFTAAEIHDFIPTQWQAGFVQLGPNQGHRLGLPRYADASLVYYNSDLIAAAGLTDPAALDRNGDWTWDQLRTYAKKLTLLDESGATRQVGLSFGTGWWFNWVWGNGGKIFDYPSHPAKFMMDQPAAIQGLEFVQRMVWNDRTTDFNGGASFIGGRGGLWLTDLQPMTTSYIPEINGKFAWNVVPMPVGPAGERGNWVDADEWGIAATTKHPDAAWEFAKYLASAEVNGMTAQQVGLAPSRISAYQDYIQMLPKFNIRQVLDTFTTSHGYPWSTTVQYADKVQPLIDQAVTDSVRNNTKSVAQAMQEIAPAIRATYQKLGVTDN